MYRFAYLLRGTSTPACSLRNNNPVESERPHKWVVNSDLLRGYSIYALSCNFQGAKGDVAAPVFIIHILGKRQTSPNVALTMTSESPRRPTGRPFQTAPDEADSSQSPAPAWAISQPAHRRR